MGDLADPKLKVSADAPLNYKVKLIPNNSSPTVIEDICNGQISLGYRVKQVFLFETKTFVLFVKA